MAKVLKGRFDAADKSPTQKSASPMALSPDDKPNLLSFPAVARDTSQRQMIQIPENPLQYEFLVKRTIRLIGEIDDDVATRVIAQLKMLDDLDPGNSDVTLIIDSGGGSVTAGMAIYDAIQSMKSDVRTVCEGFCASMAAFLLAAGAPGKRSATPNSMIMIHQPSGGSRGQATDMEIATKTITYIKKRMAETMSRHTGIDLADLKNALERDYYMSAQRAKEIGIIDTVEPALKPLPPLGRKKLPPQEPGLAPD